MGTKFIPPVIDLGLLVIAFSEGKLPGEKRCCLIVKDVKKKFYSFPFEIDSTRISNLRSMRTHFTAVSAPALLAF